jgi:hypothetical protein
MQCGDGKLQARTHKQCLLCSGLFRSRIVRAGIVVGSGIFFRAIFILFLFHTGIFLLQYWHHYLSTGLFL